eukprot:5865906-Prymnesium_polylepis.1
MICAGLREGVRRGWANAQSDRCLARSAAPSAAVSSGSSVVSPRAGGLTPTAVWPGLSVTWTR